MPNPLICVLQAYHPLSRRCGTHLAEMEATLCFTTTSGHRKPHSHYHLRPHQDPGIGTSTPTNHSPTLLRPSARHRNALYSVFDSRLPCSPTGHHCHCWNCSADVEGAMGGYSSGSPMGQRMVPVVGISPLVFHLRTAPASGLAISPSWREIQE